MSETSIIQIDTSDRRQVKQFLNLPFRIYREIPQWVPPLAGDAARMLNQHRHPYYRHSEAAFFMALDKTRQVVGRLAILNNRNYNAFNQSATAFFYLFECQDNPEIAQGLFNTAFEWARARKLREIRGPKGFSALDGMGLLIKGFEYRPAFGIPYNPPYYVKMIKTAGFEPDGDLVSGYLQRENYQLPEKILQIADLIKERRGLHVARFKTRRDLRGLVPQLKELYNASLGGTMGNVPLTDEEVQTIANQMLWFADPGLIKIIMKDDQPVGFLFAYPDISAAVQKTGGRLFPFGWLIVWQELERTKWLNINGAGIIEKYRGLGGTALLFTELFKTVTESRFEHADIVQIGLENDRMQRELRDLGIDFYKLHRMYRRSV